MTTAQVIWALEQLVEQLKAQVPDEVDGALTADDIDLDLGGDLVLQEGSEALICSLEFTAGPIHIVPLEQEASS